jgi:ABC-type transport system involved in multi-copper enzyme maturation permease subunit
MMDLLKIELKKMTSYRTFWVVCGLYFITGTLIMASGMEFLRWVNNTFNVDINISRIPIYHFPDVWLNLIWFSGLFKIILAIMVTISVTNEYSYRTVRQNIIDGMSRWEFTASKILLNLLLTLASTAMVFMIGMITGLIYSPEVTWVNVTSDLDFLIAYFLEVFMFLSYAMMLSILIQRAGLTIIVLLLTHAIEYTITWNIVDYVPGMVPFFPMRAIWNQIEFPYMRYGFQEIRDYLTFSTSAIVMGWIIIFNGISYWKMKKADL